MKKNPNQQNWGDLEWSLIEFLQSYDQSGELTMVQLLNQTFFAKGTGRSLILQNKDGYALFYLKSEAHDNPESKHNELTDLVSTFSLLEELSDSRLITLFKESHKPQEQIVCVGWELRNPKVDNGKILFVDQGLESANPEEIKNEQGKIVYKGLELTDPRLILKFSHGKIHVSPTLKTLKRKKSKHTSLIFKILYLVLFKILILIGYLTKLEMESFADYHQKEIEQKFDYLKDKIDSKSDTLFIASKSEVKKSVAPVLRYGIDVSRWNGNLLNNSLPDSVTFVISKASEGLTITDPKFAENWREVKEKELRRGAYHFYIVGDNPIQQAEFFWQHIQDLDSTDFPPILDIERGSVKSGETLDKISFQVELLTCLQHLEKLSGKKPIVYSSTSFIEENITHQNFVDYPLWIASYTEGKEPVLPVLWKEKGFYIWQRSSSYTLKSSHMDLDVFLEE